MDQESLYKLKRKKRPLLFSSCLDDTACLSQTQAIYISIISLQTLEASVVVYRRSKDAIGMHDRI